MHGQDKCTPFDENNGILAMPLHAMTVTVRTREARRHAVETIVAISRDGELTQDDSTTKTHLKHCQK
jgi:hypothetical protein